MQAGQELLRKWEVRGAGRRHARLEFRAEGLVLGAATVLAKAISNTRGRPQVTIDEPRLRTLLTMAYGRPVAPFALQKISRAAELWNEGEKALAHIHLSYAGLPPCGEGETLALFLAEECLAAGASPFELLEVVGLGPALEKYSPDQPRVPAGNGRESGRWTSDGGAGGGETSDNAHGASEAPPRNPTTPIFASVSAASTLLAEASPQFLAGLAELGATLGGAAAVLGTIFVPAPHPGLTAAGAVPGDPGLRYAIDHDEGTLRLSRDGEIVAAAQLAQDGIFYEVETGIPVARAVGGSIVFDAEVLDEATRPEEASSRAAEATPAEAEEQSPKLCPDPGPDAPHGASDRAQRYQEQISALNNPQRPLPAGLAVRLPDPATGKPVAFDDCRESDGAMIEAKGPGYAKMLESDFMDGRMREEWIDQATRQVKASVGRGLEWYFAEEKAAARAQEFFERERNLRGRISIFVVPAENLR